jgi:hypothetical protein
LPTLSPDVADIILDELRAINAKLDAYMVRTTAIETQIKPLFPNGQPGTLATYDRRISDIEHWRISMDAYAAGIAATVAAIVTLAIKFL